MTYSEAIQYFEHRAKRTDLPDRCENAEEMAIRALKFAQKSVERPLSVQKCEEVLRGAQP